MANVNDSLDTFIIWRPSKGGIRFLKDFTPKGGKADVVWTKEPKEAKTWHERSRKGGLASQTIDFLRRLMPDEADNFEFGLKQVKWIM